MKVHRTIPTDLEDWLHGGPATGVRSSLEKHPFSKAMMDSCEQRGEQLVALDALHRQPKPLFPTVASGSLELSFAV